MPSVGPRRYIRRRYARQLRKWRQRSRPSRLHAMLQGFITAFNRGILLPHGYGLAMMWSDPCAYCGDTGTTWDHIEPRARGGDARNNLTRACRRCNLSKYSTPLVIYLAERAQRRKRSGKPNAR